MVKKKSIFSPYSLPYFRIQSFRIPYTKISIPEFPTQKFPIQKTGYKGGRSALDIANTPHDRYSSGSVTWLIDQALTLLPEYGCHCAPMDAAGKTLYRSNI